MNFRLPRLRPLTIFLLVVLSQPLCLLAPVPLVRAFSLELTENRLSVAAEDVALQTVLSEFAAKGITVKIDPAINHTVTANFKNRPVEQAMESLLKPASYSLLWETDPQKGDVPGLRLAEIQVFRSGKKELMQVLQPRRSEVITRNRDGIFYVKDEILVYIPPGMDLSELHKQVLAYRATLIETGGLPGLFKLVLPENSDAFAVARALKNELNIEVAQPNYAYPMPAPVYYAMEAGQEVNASGAYDQQENVAAIAILDSGLAENPALDKFVLASLDRKSVV